jgi:hypothetical protein
VTGGVRLEAIIEQNESRSERQIIDFDARIRDNGVIIVFAKDPGQTKWDGIIKLSEIVRNFVVEEGARCSCPEDCENVKDIQWAGLLKTCLGMA